RASWRSGAPPHRVLWPVLFGALIAIVIFAVLSAYSRLSLLDSRHLGDDALMDRRIFVATLAGGLLAVPLVAVAQQDHTYHVGVVLHGGPYVAALDGLRDGLKDLGLEEGKHVVLHIESAKGDLKAAEAIARQFEVANLSRCGKSFGRSRRRSMLSVWSWPASSSRRDWLCRVPPPARYEPASCTWTACSEKTRHELVWRSSSTWTGPDDPSPARGSRAGKDWYEQHGPAASLRDPLSHKARQPPGDEPGGCMRDVGCGGWI